MDAAPQEEAHGGVLRHARGEKLADGRERQTHLQISADDRVAVDNRIDIAKAVENQAIFEPVIRWLAA